MFGVKYTVTVRGIYNMRVMIADEHVVGSPYKVIVNSTSAKAEARRLASEKILRGRVDQPVMVTIQAYDRFGNRLGAQGSSVFASVTSSKCSDRTR